MYIIAGIYFLVLCVTTLFGSVANIENFEGNSHIKYILFYNIYAYEKLCDEINLGGIVLVEALLTLFIWPVILLNIVAVLLTKIVRVARQLFFKIFAKKK